MFVSASDDEALSSDNLHSSVLIFSNGPQPCTPRWLIYRQV